MQSFLIAGILTYITLVGGLYFGQRSLLYHPNQSTPLPSEYDLNETQEVFIKGHKNIDLHAWWTAPRNNMPTLVYFHGNAGHLGDRAHKIKNLITNGYGVLLMSYRYNAQSEGSPSEEALLADGEAALNWLNSKDISSDSILLYGESLGSGIAVALAADKDVLGVVLEAPYSSVAEVAQSAYWFVPAYWLVKDKFNSLARIPRITAPILIVHGEKDKTIPVRFGQKLHAAAPEGARILLIEEAAHTDLYDFGMAEMVQEFVEKLH